MRGRGQARGTRLRARPSAPGWEGARATPPWRCEQDARRRSHTHLRRPPRNSTTRASNAPHLQHVLPQEKSPQRRSLSTGAGSCTTHPRPGIARISTTRRLGAIPYARKDIVHSVVSAIVVAQALHADGACLCDTVEELDASNFGCQCRQSRQSRAAAAEQTSKHDLCSLALRTRAKDRRNLHRLSPFVRGLACRGVTPHEPSSIAPPKGVSRTNLRDLHGEGLAMKDSRGAQCERKPSQL